jgi:hypothetical protein
MSNELENMQVYKIQDSLSSVTEDLTLSRRILSWCHLMQYSGISLQALRTDSRKSLIWHMFQNMFFWHGYVLHEGTAYQGRAPRISQMTSRLLHHTAAAMRVHNMLCNSYNSITVVTSHGRCYVRA